VGTGGSGQFSTIRRRLPATRTTASYRDSKRLSLMMQQQPHVRSSSFGTTNTDTIYNHHNGRRWRGTRTRTSLVYDPPRREMHTTTGMIYSTSTSKRALLSVRSSSSSHENDLVAGSGSSSNNNNHNDNDNGVKVIMPSPNANNDVANGSSPAAVSAAANTAATTTTTTTIIKDIDIGDLVLLEISSAHKGSSNNKKFAKTTGAVVGKQKGWYTVKVFNTLTFENSPNLRHVMLLKKRLKDLEPLHSSTFTRNIIGGAQQQQQQHSNDKNAPQDSLSETGITNIKIDKAQQYATQRAMGSILEQSMRTSYQHNAGAELSPREEMNGETSSSAADPDSGYYDDVLLPMPVRQRTGTIGGANDVWSEINKTMHNMSSSSSPSATLLLDDANNATRIGVLDVDVDVHVHVDVLEDIDLYADHNGIIVEPQTTTALNTNNRKEATKSKSKHALVVNETLTLNSNKSASMTVPPVLEENTVDVQKLQHNNNAATNNNSSSTSIGIGAKKTKAKAIPTTRQKKASSAPSTPTPLIMNLDRPIVPSVTTTDNVARSSSLILQQNATMSTSTKSNSSGGGERIKPATATTKETTDGQSHLPYIIDLDQAMTMTTSLNMDSAGNQESAIGAALLPPFTSTSAPQQNQQPWSQEMQDQCDHFATYKKWVVFTDLHCSAATLPTCLDVLDQVHHAAVNLNVNGVGVNAEGENEKAGVLFLGDFWHHRGSVRFDCLNAILDKFSKWTVPLIMIPGNHDQISMAGHDLHGLTPFRNAYRLDNAVSASEEEAGSKRKKGQAASSPATSSSVPGTMIFSHPTKFMNALFVPHIRNLQLLEQVLQSPEALSAQALFVHAEVTGAYMNNHIVSQGGISPALFPPHK
jgi:ribosomal protein L21E